MSAPMPPTLEQLLARITRLEELIAHFERTMDAFDESIRLLFKRLDIVERQIEQLRAVHPVPESRTGQ